MPSDDSDATSDDGLPKLSAWKRLTGAMSNMFLKPAVAAESVGMTESQKASADPTTVPEIQALIKRANDKERIIGLMAAPFAAGIGLVVMSALIANDPRATLANGQINSHHVNPSLYLEIGLLAVALGLVMLAMAWFRKRTFLGISMALYGLSLFNLHYWGFGVPYILAGSWYLVRAYRLQEKLKRAQADGSEGFGPAPSRAVSSKRFTPPASKPKPKRGKGLETS